MGWSKKYKKSIDCDNPKGFSQRAHCQGKKKAMSEEKKDHEYSMARSELKTVTNAVKRLQKKMGKKGEGNLEAWVQSKITKAADYIDTAADYVTNEETVKEEGLRDWFGKSKSKDGKPGWVNVVTGGTCASDEPGEGTPKCVSSAKRASMTKAERLSAARRKKAADPGQQQKTGASKPTYVSTDKPKKKVKEDFDLREEEKKAKKDACYHKVKSRYKVWPSAYASGALVKCRKVGADSWGTKTEEMEMIRYCPKCQKNETRNQCKYGPKFWDTFSTPITLSTNQMKYNIAKVHPANEEKDHEYSMARSQLSTVMSAVKRLKKKMKGEGNIEAWVQSKITKAADYLDSAADYIDSGEHDIEEAKKCWPGYEKKGTQKLFGKTYNRCVKKEQFSNWREELTEDWQKVNKQDKTDGMSQKAVNTYRRENPGSKLKTAVTGDPKPGSKDAKRRKSFCSRSKGQQDMHNIDCSKDPDKAICKARRRWKC